MSDPYIGEIRVFGFNFAPVNWAFCHGQLVPIDQFDALFTLIGTTYGGDGVTTFALPDMRGRIPIHQGQGTGLSPYTIGQIAGTESVTLTTQQLPSHGHSLLASVSGTRTTAPTNNVLGSGEADIYNRDTTATLAASSSAVATSGGGQPHANIQPSLGVNFCICVFGIFPSRN